MVARIPPCYILTSDINYHDMKETRNSDRAGCNYHDNTPLDPMIHQLCGPVAITYLNRHHIHHHHRSSTVTTAHPPPPHPLLSSHPPLPLPELPPSPIFAKQLSDLPLHSPRALSSARPKKLVMWERPQLEFQIFHCRSGFTAFLCLKTQSNFLNLSCGANKVWSLECVAALSYLHHLSMTMVSDHHCPLGMA